MEARCYRHLVADDVDANVDSTKFQIFPVEKKDDVWSVILKDHNGLWVQSTQNKPVSEKKVSRDVLIVDVNQPVMATNGTAEVFYLVPTRRVIGDYWLKRASDGCFFRQVGRVVGESHSRRRNLKDAFACDTDVYDGLGIGIELVAPPHDNVYSAYSLSVTDLSIRWKEGILKQSEAPGLLSSTVLNYANLVPRAQMASSTTRTDSISFKKDRTWGANIDVGNSFNFGPKDAGGLGISLNIAGSLTRTTTRGTETMNSSTQSIDMSSYPPSNSAMRIRAQISQSSLADVPFSYINHRTFFDGTVASWNVTGTFNVAWFEQSNVCFGQPVEMKEGEPIELVDCPLDIN
ncbi:hypothetical protein SmJEL517_g01785 [Synchytrium microbalum]|uniref:Uncharacterized protein n=1 Tax=Synchytrium microbalum TaxID=1806994 RepID=A0A507C9I4_9FUNG|nr:uncharacterized protein SmJEL517_g01785 [Synchytrium microbalum]TPX36008.1 hypothetical protein SmJEL517_g01785 [Synchytrium microbalum]